MSSFVWSRADFSHKAGNSGPVSGKEPPTLTREVPTSHGADLGQSLCPRPRPSAPVAFETPRAEHLA